MKCRSGVKIEKAPEPWRSTVATWLRPLPFLLCTLGIFLGTGCASWEGENVPLPASTPFDNNPPQRMAYLDAFRDGYRVGMREGRISHDFITGPYRFARELGWRAGAAEAVSEKTDDADPTPPGSAER